MHMDSVLNSKNNRSSNINILIIASHRVKYKPHTLVFYDKSAIRRKVSRQVKIGLFNGGQKLYKDANVTPLRSVIVSSSLFSAENAAKHSKVTLAYNNWLQLCR